MKLFGLALVAIMATIAAAKTDGLVPMPWRVRMCDTLEGYVNECAQLSQNRTLIGSNMFVPNATFPEHGIVDGNSTVELRNNCKVHWCKIGDGWGESTCKEQCKLQ
ncbi:hypothetical protein NX059_005087 [Plenodomus lindquistii]|nr:hypothetical protein NX059_005087 [Plenodomus lindquistii]